MALNLTNVTKTFVTFKASFLHENFFSHVFISNSHLWNNSQSFLLFPFLRHDIEFQSCTECSVHGRSGMCLGECVGVGTWLLGWLSPLCIHLPNIHLELPDSLEILIKYIICSFYLSVAELLLYFHYGQIFFSENPMPILWKN